MAISAKARRLPGRLATGAFILNAGVGKWSADEETAARLHGMAMGTFPFLAKLKPGMRREHSMRPTGQGTALAKDVWMLAIGLGLVVDGLAQRDGTGS